MPAATAAPLPSYAQLPVLPGAPSGSSWGVWGDRDVLGCLNLLTPERARRGAGCVRSGTVYPLDLPLEQPDPPLFGRPAFRHEVVARPSGISTDDLLHGFNTQSSSQWDGFRHVRSARFGHYCGVPSDEHGVHHWADHGIVGRGVLADVGRWRAADGRPLAVDSTDPITADDLRATLVAQRSTVETGDVLLVRTGWMSWYHSLDAGARADAAAASASCGLLPEEATAAYLWDLHIAAIAMDNPAIETLPLAFYALSPDDRAAAFDSDDPSVTARAFLHINLLAFLGLPLGELLDLDALADDCAAAGTYDFLVTSAPLRLRNGVATPPNLLAVR